MVPVTPAVSVGILLGLTLGVGLWLVISTVPRLRRPNLATRVAPYVVDVSSDARDLLDRRTADPLPVFGLVVSPVVRAGSRLLNRLFGGVETTARRLKQSGSTLTVDEFRARQLAWGAGGLVAGILIDIAAVRAHALPFVAQVGIVIVFVVGAVVLRDYLLQRAARARIARMAAELPTVLEFLTLSLSAGEGILDALRRVSRISRGELSRELATVTADVATGMPLAETLLRLSDSLELAPFTRCVEQIAGALERGTPLVEVLRAQAQDVRDEAKRELLELAGKKEVAMLVPLVFLILPVTIVFAVFPATLVLRMGF
ncbi:type II secretion system F family protein [soil metagenome]